jgi:hypothetical protein
MRSRSRSGLPGPARRSHSGPGALRPFGSRMTGGLAEPSNRPRQISLGVEAVPGHDADVAIPVVVQRQLLAGSAPGGGVLALEPVTARSVPAGPAGPSGPSGDAGRRVAVHHPVVAKRGQHLYVRQVSGASS